MMSSESLPSDCPLRTYFDVAQIWMAAVPCYQEEKLKLEIYLNHLTRPASFKTLLNITKI